MPLSFMGSFAQPCSNLVTSEPRNYCIIAGFYWYIIQNWYNLNLVCYVITGTCFKAAKCYDKASDAFKKAADAHYSAHAYPF